MSNIGRVDKTVNHTVFHGGREYRRYMNDGYCVLYPVVDGVVDYSTSVVEHRLVYELAHNIKLDADMQIHHINRNRSDNRPENLIALSASEHTQLHAAENGKVTGPNYCIDCGRPLDSHKSQRCRECADIAKRYPMPEKSELEEYIWTMTNVDIGRLYGVSAQLVSSWRKRLNLPSASEVGVKWSRRP